MNSLIPKSERKPALVSFVGMVALATTLSSWEVWTQHLRAREFVIQIGLGAAVGGLTGALLGYFAWLSVAGMRRLRSL